MYESLYSDIRLNILGLVVNSNFQGKGIGKKLMVFVEEYALNNNDLFDNYTNLEFNKINILKQGVLTPCIDKKLRLSNISNINFIRLNSGSHCLKAHKFYENIGYACNKT